MKHSDIHRIVAAKVVGSATLELQFSDGFTGSLCLTPQLWGPVFTPLNAPDYFQQFKLEDGTVRWPNGADFCPDVLRYWCESGGVRSQEETDAFFTASLAETMSI